MSSTLDLRTVKPGDVVELRETYRVAETSDQYVHLMDVQSGAHGMREAISDSAKSIFRPPASRRYILVSKAPVPAPVAGDILTGYQVRERMWKRGTVIQCVDKPTTAQRYPSPLLLQQDGEWIDTAGIRYEFEDLNDEGHFKLLHVAQ